MFRLQPEPWMERAKCKGMDTSLWFPIRGESQKIARSTCAVCPVADECWEYACRTDTSYGIWGGKIIKRGKDKNTDYPARVSYDWSNIYLDKDIYWGEIDETREPFG